MNDKNQFIIPAVIFTVAVSIVGGFWAGQAQVAWLRPASQGQPTLSTDGRAEIAGGAILNTGGATNGLIVANGNVGIGTVDSAYKVNIDGATRLNGTVLVPGGYNVGITGALQANSFTVGYDSGNQFKVDSNGNVGIGVAPDPEYRLSVQNSGGASRGIMSRATGSGIGMLINTDSGAGVYSVSNSGTGVFGSSSTGLAGYFIGNTKVDGDFDVSGNISMGYEKITKTTNNPVAATIITADCSPGKHVLGGGCSCHQQVNRNNLAYIAWGENQPAIAGEGWSCEGWNCSVAGYAITATAICAQIR